MATTEYYYLNGPDLASATAIFTDSELTICALDGFYSDGVISRELVGCVLQPEVACPSCEEPCCDNIINITGAEGVFLNTFDLDTVSVGATGAIIVYFDPAQIPDGIRATYNGAVYNEVTNALDGYKASTTAGNPTYLGDSAFDRTATCDLVAGSPHLGVDEYKVVNGVPIATGNTLTVNIAAGDVALKAVPLPDWYVMVIPKTTAAPSTVDIEITGVCPTTGWYLEVGCPVKLVGAKYSRVDDCSDPAFTYTLYNVPCVKIDPCNPTLLGVPSLYDWVFKDENGEVKLADGPYILEATPDNQQIVVSDGVIVSMTPCP